MLTFPPAALDAVLDAGAPIVTYSWGQPGSLVDKVHRSGGLAGVQVGSADGARLAWDSGADFVICPGIEVGGHVQSSRPLVALLAEVLQAGVDVPVVAARSVISPSCRT